ncbi:MAG: hypothetical protein HYR94_02720 [Chloroflexi bacterium]|nr:hypothetical protein [Chloroflexota bacterium]
MKKDKFEIIDQTYQETVVVDSFFEKPIESLIEIETETVSPSTGESTVEQEAELSGSEVVSPELLVEETSLEYQPEETSSETTQLLAMIEEQPIEVNLAGTSDLGEIQPEVALVELLDEEDPLVLATTSLALPWWKRIWRYESKQDNGVLQYDPHGAD